MNPARSQNVAMIDPVHTPFLFAQTSELVFCDSSKALGDIVATYEFERVTGFLGKCGSRTSTHVTQQLHSCSIQSLLRNGACRHHHVVIMSLLPLPAHPPPDHPEVPKRGSNSNLRNPEHIVPEKPGGTDL